MNNYLIVGPEHAYLCVTSPSYLYPLSRQLLVSSFPQCLEKIIRDETAQAVARHVTDPGVLFAYQSGVLTSYAVSPNLAALSLPKEWTQERYTTTRKALARYADVLSNSSSAVQVGVLGQKGIAVGTNTTISSKLNILKSSDEHRQSHFLSLMLSYAHKVTAEKSNHYVDQWYRFIERETRLSYEFLDNLEAAFHQRRATAWLYKEPDPSACEHAKKALIDRWKRQGFASILSTVDMQTFDSTREHAEVFRREIADAIRKCYHVETRVYAHLPLIEVRVPYADAPTMAQALSEHKLSTNGLQTLLTSELESPCYLPPIVRQRVPMLLEEVLWNLELVQAPEAWGETKGKGIVVAVVDTGADYEHPEIAARFGSLRGTNCYNDTDDPFDDNEHGTHVSGTIAGKKTGVAPNATLYAVKVLGKDGSGSTQTVLKGLEWCLSNKVDIVNMSLGSEFPSPAFERAVKELYKAGICVIASAGNTGNHTPNYPASYPGVISVAAIDRYKERARFSTMQPENDLTAPGVAIYSSVPDGEYAVFDGTSMASPHVAGCSALLLATKQGLSPQDVEKILIKTALPLGVPGDQDRRAKFGFGLVQAHNALIEVSNEPSIRRTLMRSRSRLYNLLRPRA